MQHINFTGHHIEITPALRDFTSSKFHKLLRHTDKITSIHVTFTVEKLNQIAEATLHVPGDEIYASSKSEDMYSSIDKLIEKLNKQLTKYKEKMTERHKTD